jgi:hypothetical protein
VTAGAIADNAIIIIIIIVNESLILGQIPWLMDSDGERG